jgi:hypothetical protein
MRQNRHGIDRTQFDAQRELDQVIGRYEPNAGERVLVRFGKGIVRAMVALCLAVGAATAIVLTLDFHMRKAETAPAPPRPITVQILPPAKPAPREGPVVP